MRGPCTAVAAILAGLAVAFGAFGAHGLKGRLDPELLAIFEVGVRYQMYHALGILAAAALAPERLKLIAGLFGAGIVLFSGSLYLLAVTDVRWLGAITPFGGLCFLAGWAAFAAAVRR